MAVRCTVATNCDRIMQCSWRLWFGTWAADLAYDNKRTIWGAAKKTRLAGSNLCNIFTSSFVRPTAHRTGSRHMLGLGLGSARRTCSINNGSRRVRFSVGCVRSEQDIVCGTFIQTPDIWLRGSGGGQSRLVQACICLPDAIPVVAR